MSSDGVSVLLSKAAKQQIPNNNNSTIFEQLAIHIKQAEQSIFISSYNLFHEGLIELLIQAQHRLSQNESYFSTQPIEIYLDETQQRKYDSGAKVRKMRTAGIKVCLCNLTEQSESDTASLHTKVFIKDPTPQGNKNGVAIVGSSNLSFNAENNSFEMSLEVTGPVVHDIYTTMSDLLRDMSNNICSCHE